MPIFLFDGQKQKDNMWRDIVLMDINHILLGRLWRHNRCAIHDGRKNTYTFKLNKVKIVLLVWKEEFALGPLTQR